MNRKIDLAMAIAGLAITTPINIIIAIAVKLDSKGPILFRQKRVGLNQREFTIYKFRTMVEDAENFKEKYSHLNETTEPAFKIKRDPRTTRVGKILRRFHLDEIPNLINVIFGEMSLIGFRPPIPSELKDYKKDYFERFDAIPGIMSPWTADLYHKCSFDKWILSDIGYNKNKNLSTDIKIILDTLKRIITEK